MKLAGLQKTAAQWFVQLRARPVTPRLDARFRRWLTRDAQHELDFERYELVWELAGELQRDEEMAALVADAERKVASTRQPARRQIMLWSAAASAAVMVLVGIATHVIVQGSAETYLTRVGEQRTVMLPDQSRMVMNTATRARVVYKRGVRIVELHEGEASFTVTRNPSRPFEVHAKNGIARALGTEFNVLASSTGVTVAVLSGKVEVTASEPANAADTSSPFAVLTRGEEVTYAQAQMSPVRPGDTSRIEAWHSGRVAFEDVPLGQALEEFNRYARTPIVLQDASLAKLRVWGVFRIGETDALLKALNTAFGLRAVYRKETIEIGRQDPV